MRTASRIRLPLLILTLAAAAFLVSSFYDGREAVRLPYEDHRVPVRSPPVEPDRPDLFEESGFTDQPER